MFNKIKILTFFLLFSFSFNQNLGMLKSHKKKSSVGFFVTSNFLYKGNNNTQNIRDIPERFKFQLTYSSALNFDISSGFGRGEVEITGENEKYKNTFFGFGYHFYKRKWGSSIDVKKTVWHASNELLNNDNVSFGFTIYSKTKYHPYFSFINVFFDKDEANKEIIAFGGMRQIDEYIADPLGNQYSAVVHWGVNIFLKDNNFEILKDNASFFVGLGFEFF